ASAWRDLRYHARGGEGFGGERRAAAVYDRAAAHLHQAGSRGPLPTACGAQAPGRRGGGPAARRGRGRGGADGCTGGGAGGGRPLARSADAGGGRERRT